MREYGERVAEMILVEGSAHEICVVLHLCLFSPSPVPTKSADGTKLIGDAFLSFDRYMPKTMINDAMEKLKESYPTFHSQVQDVVSRWTSDAKEDEKVEEKPTCALCEFVMTQLDSMLENNSTEVIIEI